MLGNHLPEAVARGISGDALKHQGSGTDGEWAIDDIGVASDPTDVSGAPIGFTLAIVEHILHRHGCLQQVAARGVQDAFGFARGTRGIENKQWVFAVHPLRLTVITDRGGGFVVPDVPTLDPVGLASGASHHDDAINAVDLRQCRVDVVFEWHGFAATHPLIRGNHHAAGSIINAIFERLRGEATEDDRVDGTDPCTGEHGERRFGNHGHIDANAIALADPLRPHRVSEATNLNLELLIGKPLGVVGVIPLPDNRGFICALRQVPVYAVHGDVQLGVDKPAGRSFGDICFRDSGPGRLPVE